MLCLRGFSSCELRTGGIWSQQLAHQGNGRLHFHLLRVNLQTFLSHIAESLFTLQRRKVQGHGCHSWAQCRIWISEPGLMIYKDVACLPLCSGKIKGRVWAKWNFPYYPPQASKYNPSASHGLRLRFADLVLYCTYEAYGASKRRLYPLTALYRLYHKSSTSEKTEFG